MVFVFAVVFLVVVAQNPHEVLLLGAVLYGASGPIIWLYNNRFAKKDASKAPTAGARAVKSTKEGVATAKPVQNQVKAVKRSTPKKTSKVNPEINDSKGEKDSQSEAAEQKPAGKDTD
jgi:hypothetical protein